jgi:hypothetical protein
MSTPFFSRRCIVLTTLAVLCGNAAWAQGTPPAATSAGPGRITCTSAKSCVLGVGTPVSISYKIDASDLPDADKTRLVKQCTAKASPCVATVTGNETKSVIKAATIKFYN